MDRIVSRWIVGILTGVFGASVAWSAGPAEPASLADPDFREAQVRTLAAKAEAERQAALAVAKQQGWATEGERNGRRFQLIAIRDGRVIMLGTDNVNAAISTGANLIRNVSPYNLNGASRTIGIWDGGAVRSTHQEFGSRVTIKDGGTADDHATHVAGTIGAAGVDASALGMVPSVLIDSYEWTNDESEMAGRAMAVVGESGKIQVSSHSYGLITGWYGTSWYGNWPAREDESFGQYGDGAQGWDQICWNAPYFVQFKSAGNDRDDAAPSSGSSFQYWSGSAWVTKAYDPATDPYSDGYDSGFDTISDAGVGKNIITVGAVNDAVAGGVRSIGAGTMASFSGWGPTDDGRIKPDIVANGVSLYSSVASSNTSYSSYSGTSMSTPNASGSAMLLLQYYGNLLPGQYMRASTLKGLILHTADDVDLVGPDYRTGWGLMNVKAAADLIAKHAQYPTLGLIREDVLNAGNPVRTYPFSWDGTGPIQATLCWTDPPAGAVSGLDNTAGRLIHDLDLRIVGPGSATYLPFAPNPSARTTAAPTGDNIRDNVEQIRIAAPSAGLYAVTVSHKAALAYGQQNFSLVLSGAGAGSSGIIALGQAVLGCTGLASISLSDGDLLGAGTQQVTVGTTGGDLETVTLSESPPTSGLFQGSMALGSGTPTSQDGTLQVADGATVTVSYQDLDDGTGNPALSTDEAAVDCVPPAISNVNVTGLSSVGATITFQTGESATAGVRVGTGCGSLGALQPSGGAGTAHTVTLAGLSPQITYYFNVSASDAIGNTAVDNNAGACYSFTTPDQRDYFSELFTSKDFSYRSVLLTPDGSSDFYMACSENALVLPVDPAGGTTLSLGDDGYSQVVIPNGNSFPLYGTPYTSFYVSGNGYVTFTQGDGDWEETLADHFRLPRLSAFFDDLNSTISGTISYKFLSAAAVVTYSGVAEYGTTNTNTFQIEMFYDGRVRFTWLLMGADDGLVGLSQGSGTPVDYVASNMTGYGSCTHPADFDADGDVDLGDFSHMQLCLGGPGSGVTSGCEDTDFEGDSDTDGIDLNLFLNCLSGADQPVDSDCLP